MCTTCGCSDTTQTVITHLNDAPSPQVSPRHVHHGHGASENRESLHTSDHGRRLIEMNYDILQRNNAIAEWNRRWFTERNILALNIMSSPGAGKTTLLEKMISERESDFRFHVIEGDQATMRDAERIRAKGCPVVQINTGAACHLDAQMVSTAMQQLNPFNESTLLIENVGNLVCPALFDLGERYRIVMTSVTEGDDKPEKYPHIFHRADVIVLNKIDLLPHVNFHKEAFQKRIVSLNSMAQLFTLSAMSGEGMEEWYRWLQTSRQRPHS